jgi:hypothetical protein
MRTILYLCLICLFCNNVFGGIKLKGISTVDLPANSHFGWTVSVDDEFAAISAPNENCDSVISAGAVYIYRNIDNEWILYQRLVPSDPSIYKLFGSSLKLKGSTLMIGAPNDNIKKGSVYVFRFENELWVQRQKIVPENPFPFEMFGNTVDLFENFAVIGSISREINSVSSGTVYLFSFLDNEWKETDKLMSPETNTNDLFGVSLTIAGNDQILVGAPMGLSTKQNTGVVYSFKKINAHWQINQQIESAEPAERGLFGGSLSFSGNRILIGAMQEMVDSVRSGAAYVFSAFNSENWILEQRLVPENPVIHDYFGMMLALNDSLAIIGSPKWEDSEINRDMGSADVFQFNNNQWDFVDKIISPEGDKDDHFALAIASDKNSIVIGSRLDDVASINNGSVSFYQTHDFYTSVESIDETENWGFVKVYPNPFKNQTSISFILYDYETVTLEIFDIKGEKIRVLANNFYTQGNNEIIWDRKNNNGIKVPGGNYICKLTYNNTVNYKIIIAN